MTRSSIKRFLEDHSLLVLSGSLLLFFFLSWLWYRDFRVGDDTYIYLQFVKHLLHGDGLCFNIGEPTYGFTSIVWVLILSGFSVLLGDYVVASIVASLLVSILVIVLGWYFAYRSTADRAFAASVALFFALDPNLLKHSWFGMETPLSGLLILATVVLYIKERSLRKVGPWSALCCSAAVLNRPESAIVAAFIVVDQIWNGYGLKAVSRWIILTFLPVVVWATIAYLYFGSALPNTVFAKGGAFPPFKRFFINLKDTVFILGPAYFIMLIPLGAQLWQTRLMPKTERNIWIRQYWLFYAIPFALVSVYCVMVSSELVYARYFFLFVPIAAYEAVRVLVKSAGVFQNAARRFIAVGILFQFILISFFMSRGLEKTFVGPERAHREFCEWVRNNTDNNATIAATAIGEIGFLTDRRIICTMGILNPEIIPYKAHNRIADYFRKTQPNYFFLTGTTSDENADEFTGGKGIVVHSVPVPGAFLLRQLWSPTEANREQYLNLIEVKWPR